MNEIILKLDEILKKSVETLCARDEKYLTMLREIIAADKVCESPGFQFKDVPSVQGGNISALMTCGIIQQTYKSANYTHWRLCVDAREIEGILDDIELCKLEAEKSRLQATEGKVAQSVLDPALEEKFKKMLVDGTNMLEYWSKWINPKIEGLDHVKKAILLSIASHGDKFGDRGRIHCLMFGEPGCLAAGSLVTMGDGSFRRIESMQERIGEFVRVDRRLAYDISRAKIIHFFKYNDTPTLKIITETGKELIASHEHPLWVYKEERTGKFRTRSFSKQWVKAKDLRIGDKVKVLRKISCAKKSYIKINNSIICDEKIAWLWGYLIGDGNTGNNINGKHYRTTAYFSEDEYDVRDLFLQDMTTLFSLEPYIYVRNPIGKKKSTLDGRLITRTKEITELQYNSGTLTQLLYMDKQPARVVPDEILASKKTVVARFLSGLFEADGSVHQHSGQNRRIKSRITLKSSSHQLLLDVQTLLLKFGIIARINQNNLSIARQSDILTFADEIGFISNRKKAILETAVSQALIAKSHFHGLMYERIKTISPMMDNVDVFDIEVDSAHRFISNGIISHNSAKSALKDWVVYQLGAESCSQRTSKVGLTGCATGQEITPGALARAHGKVLCIDELDKFNSEDRQALLESQEEGVVLIEVGGMNARFDAECRIIACANVIEKFSPELLDRFDFRIEMKSPSSDIEKRIVCSVLDHWFESKEGYDGRELNSYIQWIKSFEPAIPKDVREKAKLLIQMLIDFEESIRGSMRKKESVLRVAFTIAKLHRRNVEVKDFLTSIKLLFPAMNGGKIQALEQLAAVK